ncbi:hypothetical protein SDC9_84218 [bioreactor metagenome]|uniref:Uncharacterized protein n=1 Tax=bioreactor metagenome TaxID=1076179 RepID=A0A644Z9N8_9ZZZZ
MGEERKAVLIFQSLQSGHKLSDGLAEIGHIDAGSKPDEFVVREVKLFLDRHTHKLDTVPRAHRFRYLLRVSVMKRIAKQNCFFHSSSLPPVIPASVLVGSMSFCHKYV